VQAEAPTKEVSAEAAAAPPRSGSGTAWVALLFAAVLGAVLLDKAGKLEQRVGEMDVALSGRLASLERAGSAQEERQERRDRETATALREAREAQAAALAAGVGPVQRDALAAREGIEAVRDELASLGRTLASGSASLRGDIAALRERVAVLEEVRSLADKRLVALEQASGGGLALPVPGGSPPIAPEWTDALEKIASEDPMVRMEAVYALGESRDVNVAPHLLPLLEDGDSLVCMAVVRILGDLGAKVAVPALIETLDHDHRAVREGAMIALRGITKRSFNYDPAASEEKRKARRDAWRGWWAKDGADFLAEE
jgi:HEAT repeat protein